MGCNSSNAVEEPQKPTTNTNFNPIPYQDIITNTEIGKFKDMEETDKERYLGEGVKRIHNYKCPLAINRLEQLRQQFWLTRNQADENWKILKLCCETDHNEAKKLLEKNEMVCLQNNIQYTYNKNQPNFVYHLPNFVICDPVFEKDYTNYEEVYDSIEDVILNIKLHYVSKGIYYDTKFRNKNTGFDVVHRFIKLSNIDNRVYIVRVFFGGQEIEETHCLYYHQIKDNDTLQILTTERGDTPQTYSKLISRKTAKRLEMMEKIKKKMENEDDESWTEKHVMSTGNAIESEGSLDISNYEKKLMEKKENDENKKKKKKKKAKKKVKQEEEQKAIKEENEEDEGVSEIGHSEKRW